jgi:hypothetical protein
MQQQLSERKLKFRHLNFNKSLCFSNQKRNKNLMMGTVLSQQKNVNSLKAHVNGKREHGMLAGRVRELEVASPGGLSG